MDIITYSNK